MPYNGTWEQTKKMRSVTAVHSTFWLNGTCVAKVSRLHLNVKSLGCVPCGRVTKLQAGTEGTDGRGSETGLESVQ